MEWIAIEEVGDKNMGFENIEYLNHWLRQINTERTTKDRFRKYGLEIVFGFTDSIFIKNASLDATNRLILECKVSCNTRTQESIHKHDNIW
jgi:hypothetical protein